LANELADVVMELRKDTKFQNFCRLQLTAPAIQPLAWSSAMSDDVEMVDSAEASDSNPQNPDQPRVEMCAEWFLSTAKEYQRLRELGDEVAAEVYIHALCSDALCLPRALCADAFDQLWRCLAGPAAWDLTLMHDAMDIISFDRFWLADSSGHEECAERRPNLGIGPVFSYVEESEDGCNEFVRGFTVETMQQILARATQVDDQQRSMHHPMSGAAIPAQAWKRAAALICLLVFQGKIANQMEVADPTKPELPLTVVKISQMALAIFQRFALKSIFIDSQTKFMVLCQADLWLLLAILRELCDAHLCSCMASMPSFRRAIINPTTIELQHYILEEVHAATGERILSEPVNGLPKETVEQLTMSIVEIALRTVNGDPWGGSQFSPIIHKVVHCYRMPWPRRCRILHKCC
jgi:hypothetical protein